MCDVSRLLNLLLKMMSLLKTSLHSALCEYREVYQRNRSHSSRRHSREGSGLVAALHDYIGGLRH